MKYNYKSVVFPPLWHSQMELEKPVNKIIFSSKDLKLIAKLRSTQIDSSGLGCNTKNTTEKHTDICTMATDYEQYENNTRNSAQNKTQSTTKLSPGSSVNNKNKKTTNASTVVPKILQTTGN